jgi:hypothetical protein
METPQKKTTYGDAKKRYYEKNKETIAQKEKEEKRWRDYYEKNKEVVRRRNLERYYAKQGRTPPPPPPATPPDLPAVDDVRSLIKRLQEILPVLTKAEKKKRGKSPETVPAVSPPAEAVVA